MTAAILPLSLHPMHARPSPGRRLSVWMRDGSRRECHSTQVTLIGRDKSGIVIYHGKRAIDESRAQGWAYDDSRREHG